MLAVVVPRLFALCFFACLVWCVSVASPVLAREAGSAATFGRPSYDARQQVLRIPFEGVPPAYTQGTARRPYRVYFDFQAEARRPGLVTERVEGHPVLRAWAMGQHRPRTTRVTLTLVDDALVLVALDKARRHIVLAPRRRPVPVLAQTPVPLVETPSATLSIPPVAAAVEGDGAASAATPGNIQEVLDRLAVLNRPLSMPVEPGVNYVPGSPDEAASPTPAPLPPAPNAVFPEAVALQPLPQPSPRERYDLQLSSAAMAGSYAATLPGFDNEARSDARGLFGARLHGRWGVPAEPGGLHAWWSHQLDVYAGSVTFSDPQIAEGLHARQSWRLHAAGLRSFRAAGVEMQAGFGIAAKQDHSWRAVAPLQGGAISEGHRFWWAPEAVVMTHIPLLGGVQLYGEGAYSPTLWVVDSGAVLEPQPTSAQRLEAGLAWNWKSLRVAVGYRRWSVASMGYTEATQGPVLTLGGWVVGL